MIPPLATAALALLGGIGVIGAGLAALPGVAAPETLRQGGALYAAACAGCHGGRMEGGAGPALDASGHAWRHGDAALARRIARGGDGMPGFADRLGPAETEALLAYVKRHWPAGLRSAQAALDAAALRASLADPEGLLPAACD